MLSHFPPTPPPFLNIYIQADQASYVAKEWVDHALSKSKEAESRRIATTKA